MSQQVHQSRKERERRDLKVSGHNSQTEKRCMKESFMIVCTLCIVPFTLPVRSDNEYWLSGPLKGQSKCFSVVFLLRELKASG